MPPRTDTCAGPPAVTRPRGTPKKPGRKNARAFLFSALKSETQRTGAVCSVRPMAAFRIGVETRIIFRSGLF
jgi:hypothetical protein